MTKETKRVLTVGSVLVAQENLVSLQGFEIPKGTELELIGADFEWGTEIYIFEGKIKEKIKKFFLYEFQTRDFIEKGD